MSSQRCGYLPVHNVAIEKQYQICGLKFIRLLENNVLLLPFHLTREVSVQLREVQRCHTQEKLLSGCDTIGLGEWVLRLRNQGSQNYADDLRFVNPSKTTRHFRAPVR